MSIPAGAEPLQIEIDYGPFERIIALPSGADADRITAEFRAGLLRVTVPISTQTRTVHVRSGDAKD